MPDADSNVTLAIEASGPDASVGVGRGESLLHLEPVSNAARHDDDLMPAVLRAFDRITASANDLEALCVSIGPGGFTGLRIAVATAKMLAFALGCRLYAVTEAQAVAEAAGDAATLTICLAGKRGSYWTLTGKVSEVSRGQLLTTAEIIEMALAAGTDRIAVSQPLGRVLDLAAAAADAGIDLVEIHPDASHVWHAGRRLAAAGAATAPESLIPIYPREPEAIRLWRERKS